MGTQPTISVGEPLLDNGGGHGVKRSPGNERHGARLRPMGQLSLNDGDVGLVVEETKRQQRLTRSFSGHPRFPHAERGDYYTLRFHTRTVLRRTLLFAV